MASVSTLSVETSATGSGAACAVRGVRCAIGDCGAFVTLGFCLNVGCKTLALAACGVIVPDASGSEGFGLITLRASGAFRRFTKASTVVARSGVVFSLSAKEAS